MTTTIDDLDHMRVMLHRVLAGIRQARDAAPVGSHEKVVLRKASKETDRIERHLSELLDVADNEEIVSDHINQCGRLFAETEDDK